MNKENINQVINQLIQSNGTFEGFENFLTDSENNELVLNWLSYSLIKHLTDLDPSTGWNYNKSNILLYAFLLLKKYCILNDTTMENRLRDSLIQLVPQPIIESIFNE